jgi:hypothetical protein
MKIFLLSLIFAAFLAAGNVADESGNAYVSYFSFVFKAHALTERRLRI